MPQIEWTQGDRGNSSEAGGWLRVFGRALAFGPDTSGSGGGGGRLRCIPEREAAAGVMASRIRLRPAWSPGVWTELKLSAASCYAITARVPTEFPPGTYELSLSNGIAESAWVQSNRTTFTVVAPRSWPTDVFDVVKLGSVWKAMEAAKNNSGGIVHFRRGTYSFDENHTLDNIPPNTVIRGESAALVSFHWADMQNPPPALITGDWKYSGYQHQCVGNWLLTNVTIHVQLNFHSIIWDKGCDDVRVIGVRIRSNPMYYLMPGPDPAFRGRNSTCGHSYGQGAAIQMVGSNFEVSDNDVFHGGQILLQIDPHGPLAGADGPRFGLVTNNSFAFGFRCYHMEQFAALIFEHNVLEGAGLSSMGNDITNFYGTATEKLWFAHNRQYRQLGADHEMMTLDGVDGFYWGHVTLDRREARLARELSDRDYLPPAVSSKRQSFAGAIFQVLSGAGAGQWARVTANTHTTVVLDRELEHSLDGTSMVSIVPYRGNLMFVANTYEDGGPFQLYGDAHSCLIAENTGTRMDGFSGVGLVRWGWNPNWYNLFVDNRVLEGNALGGLTAEFAASGSYSVRSGASGEWSIPSNDPTGYLGNLSGGALQLGAVFRRNNAMSSTRIVIDGSTEVALVEHNHLSKVPVGISVTNRTADVFLVGNTFDDVHQEYCFETPAMHERACYVPPTVGPAGPAPPLLDGGDPSIDPLTGVQKASWRLKSDDRVHRWPRPSIFRGWAFAYNFTVQPRSGKGPLNQGVASMYPTGTTNLDTTSANTMSPALVAEYRQRGIMPLGWSYCWDDPYVHNKSIAIADFAKFARGSNFTAGQGLDECNKDNGRYPHEREWAAAGFRTGKRAGHLLAGWGANTGDEVFASLMADGTFDLALVEGYTYCPGCGEWPANGKCCPTKGTAHIEQYFDRLDFARARGYINRTLFCFGFMQGKSTINPRGWTTPMLRATMLQLRAAYPELAGVIMYGQSPLRGFPNATNASTAESVLATVNLIRAANELMLELYPDRPTSHPSTSSKADDATRTSESAPEIGRAVSSSTHVKNDDGRSDDGLATLTGISPQWPMWRLKSDDSQPPPPLPPWVPPAGGFPTNPCPCGELCKPLRRSALENRTKAQFFGFFATKIYNGSGDAWLDWDWQTISTVEVWSTWHLPAANWGILCRAHAEGVRVVVPLRGGCGKDYCLDTATARKEWVVTQMVELTHFGLDGANFDVEGQYNASRKAALTRLVCETKHAMNQYLPDATLTFDLSITPDNPTTRAGYDYPALAKCLDHIIPM